MVLAFGAQNHQFRILPGPCISAMHLFICVFVTDFARKKVQYLITALEFSLAQWLWYWLIVQVRFRSYISAMHLFICFLVTDFVCKIIIFLHFEMEPNIRRQFQICDNFMKVLVLVTLWEKEVIAFTSKFYTSQNVLKSIFPLTNKKYENIDKDFFLKKLPVTRFFSLFPQCFQQNSPFFQIQAQHAGA